MSVLTNDKRFVEMLDSEEGRPENMCEVLDRAETRGEERGRIKEAICIYRGEMGLDLSEIEKKIMDRFTLTREEAEQYLKEVIQSEHVCCLHERCDWQNSGTAGHWTD